jgi:hypothetical protein
MGCAIGVLSQVPRSPLPAADVLENIPLFNYLMVQEIAHGPHLRCPSAVFARQARAPVLAKDEGDACL